MTIGDFKKFSDCSWGLVIRSFSLLCELFMPPNINPTINKLKHRKERVQEFIQCYPRFRLKNNFLGMIFIIGLFPIILATMIFSDTYPLLQTFFQYLFPKSLQPGAYPNFSACSLQFIFFRAE
jgi:hypothetical protein